MAHEYLGEPKAKPFTKYRITVASPESCASSSSSSSLLPPGQLGRGGETVTVLGGPPIPCIPRDRPLSPNGFVVWEPWNHTHSIQPGTRLTLHSFSHYTVPRLWLIAYSTAKLGNLSRCAIALYPLIPFRGCHQRSDMTQTVTVSIVSSVSRPRGCANQNGWTNVTLYLYRIPFPHLSHRSHLGSMPLGRFIQPSRQ